MLENINEEPNSVDAEVCALGCGFLSSVALEKMVDELTDDMFYDKRNAVIYRALYNIYQRKEAMDVTVLKNEIEKECAINSIGGLEYLSEVIDSVVSASSIESYIRIIREKAIRRNLIKTCENIENSARDESMETYDVVEMAEKDIFAVSKARRTSEFRTSAEVVKTAKDLLEGLAKAGKEVTGVPTGFYDLDKLTSGLHPSELIIIAARPAMGKTAFALNVAVNAAKNIEQGVAIFNLEMSAEQLMFRMISAEGAVEGNKLKTGMLNHDDWKRVNEAMSTLSDAPIYMEDSATTIGEIRAKCRRLASSPKGLGLIVIDYLQLISGGSGYGSNRQQEVSDISRGLKMMAMELHVPVIALAQLSRAVEGRPDKRPLMSDLRESGSIEQDADMVGFLYRDDYYNKETMNKDVSISEFIIGKNRNGPTKTIEFLFKGSTVTFANYEGNKEE
jgi:replicative DNA helicase